MTLLAGAVKRPCDRVVAVVGSVCMLDYFAALLSACEQVAKGRKRTLLLRHVPGGFELIEREGNE